MGWRWSLSRHHRRRHHRSPCESLPSAAIFVQGLSGRPANRASSLAIEPRVDECAFFVDFTLYNAEQHLQLVWYDGILRAIPSIHLVPCIYPLGIRLFLNRDVIS